MSLKNIYENQDPTLETKMRTRWSFVLGLFSSPPNFFDGCFARAEQQQQHRH
jgi:hypothetical protein